MVRTIIYMFKFLIVISLVFFYFIDLQAANYGSDSGYKIPRFVSLKSDKVNLRIGSSTNYSIILQYNKINLPVEIIDEYKNWRKIIDIEGNKGWINKNLLKGDRYAMINTDKKLYVNVFSKPDGKKIGQIENLVIIKLKRCLIKWCLFKTGKQKGWIKKNKIWVTYKDEKINIPFYQPIIKLCWKINF